MTDLAIAHRPSVQASIWCAICGMRAHDVDQRAREVAELVMAAEAETHATPAHGETRLLELPAFPSCGHVATLPLPLWRSSVDGRFYYAEQRRWWE